jgi:2-dehydro-3-deoxygalactonokinase
MRGEETQIAGLLGLRPGFTGLCILPGTHAKWVTVAHGGIADFQSFITGELFELLAKRSFLRHSVAQEEAGDLAARPDFAIGVKRTVDAGLPFLASLFSVRVRSLIDGCDPSENLAYLSGLVIGGEIAAARATGRLKPDAHPVIVGSRSLARAYGTALLISGHKAEFLDGGELVRAGLIAVARDIGWLAKGK